MIISLFVILLVLTGWALNHTAELGLARLSMNTPWITAWYGLRGTAPATGYTASGHWLISNENGALLDGKSLTVSAPNAIGLVVTPTLIAIATTNELILLDHQHRVIEQLRGAQLPTAPIKRIGAVGDKIVLQGSNIVASADGIEWPVFAGAAIWSTPQRLPPGQLIFAQQLLPGIALERLIQDIHSGRILGHFGPYLMDAVGLIFMLLAASGLWMFFRHRRR